MLQQTQTVKVRHYFDTFLKQFPTIPVLADASIDDVLKAWEGLGYYARARNLHKGAQYIAEHLGGTLPDNYDALIEIPGIGSYSAAAIASIAFHEPVAVVDGNVVRVLSRFLKYEKNTKRTSARSFLRESAQELLDTSRPGDFNQALMELGATICLPRKPKCVFCPVNSTCRGYNELMDPARLPLKSVVKKIPHYDYAVGIVWDEGLVLIQKREQDGLLGGLWEFPNFRADENQPPEALLGEILQNKYKIEVGIGEILTTVKHAFSHFKITLHVYHCIYKNGEPPYNIAPDWSWVRLDELKYYAFSAAHKRIAEKLAALFLHSPTTDRS